MTLVGVIEAGEATALEEYLALKKRQFVKASGGDIGNEETISLRQDLSRLCGRIEAFLTDKEEQSDSHLVLGKVQSGKTAHMLGVVAALVNSSCSLVVLVSGVTGQLNRQTQRRLNKDIGNLPSVQVHVMPVPTIGELSRQDSQFISDLRTMVNRRIESTRVGSSRVANLPVLAMLENVHRVEALKAILEDLNGEFGSEFQVVIIDDEADQASPNGLARLGDETTIYGLLREIRQSGLRNCLLSYTATPQAVLLAAKTGALRPRHCCVLSVGKQYFGIEDVCKDIASNRLIKLTDVPAASQLTYPHSLREAFVDFLLLACIRRNSPELFFSCDENINRSTHDFIPESQSMQMLIHPSGRQRDHLKYHRWIKEIKVDIEQKLGYRVNSPDPEFVRRELQPAYERVLLRSEVPGGLLPLDIPPHWVENITAALVGSTGLIVVNADPTRPTEGVQMPDDDDKWSEKMQWILIGGDILGRGVTMPNLVSTYFLRSPKETNFDTLSQQMRFCGYRSRYKKFVYIYAPDVINKRFAEADVVDRVIYRYALKWDKENLDLVRFPPEVMHAQRGRSDIRPTRLNVLDSNIRSTTLNEVPFAATNILLPSVAVANAQLVVDLVKDKTVSFNSGETDWDIFEDVQLRDFEKLFTWHCCGSRDKTKLSSAKTLFDVELQEAGLAAVKKVIAFRGAGLVKKLAEVDRSEDWFSAKWTDNTAFRSLRIDSRMLLGQQTADEARGEWLRQLGNSDGPIPRWMIHGEMQYEGDPQRRLRDGVVTSRIGSCVIFVIEPVFVLSDTRSQGGKHLALGLELAILAPKDFSLSTWTVPA